MNCEKCKNRKATLFYADDGGGRHALCAVCGEKQSKVLSFSPPAADRTEKEPHGYYPESSLLSLAQKKEFSVFSKDEKSGTERCKSCGMSVEQLKSEGFPACPECYEAFSVYLFPSPASSVPTVGARMPSARRARLERQRLLGETRAELRRAVDSENYELAATLRDRIRDLEGGSIL